MLSASFTGKLGEVSGEKKYKSCGMVFHQGGLLSGVRIHTTPALDRQQNKALGIQTIYVEIWRKWCEETKNVVLKEEWSLIRPVSDQRVPLYPVPHQCLNNDSNEILIKCKPLALYPRARRAVQKNQKTAFSCMLQLPSFGIS